MRISDWSSDVCSSDLFDERQQIALHALAGNVAADPLRARGDLVDLVEEDDAVLLHGLDRLGGQLLLVEQLVALLGHQPAIGIRHRRAALPGASADGLAQHVRSEERSVGQECVSQCRSRWLMYHNKIKPKYSSHMIIT